MGITELFLGLSLLFNYWQYGNISEIETKSENYKQIAKACQEAKQDNRIIELRAQNVRSETERNIERISSKSQQQLRLISKNDSDKCGSMVYTSGSKRVESHIKRTKDINSEWLRSTSIPNE